MAVVPYALTTLDKVKSYLGITSSSHDTLLESLIDEITVFVEMECGDRRFFNDGNDVENEEHDGDYDGTKRCKIFLKRWPVVSVTSVQYKSGTNSNPAWTSLTLDEYDVNEDIGVIYVTGGLNKGLRNYRVTYEAGYENIPLDLELACTKLVAKEFDKRKSQGMTSESLGGSNVNWKENIDPSAQRIFNKYRRFY